MQNRRSLVCIACLALMLLLTGCGQVDYELGYNQGVEDVRQLRKEKGWSTQIAVELGVAMSMLPVHEDKSADWNAGYQQGVKDEFAK